LRIPARGMPQGHCKGKFNYTIKSSCGCTIEVQLANTMFRAIRGVGGQVWNIPTQGSPAVQWARFETLDLALDEAFKLVGWV
jgi:hypothetical protein